MIRQHLFLCLGMFPSRPCAKINQKSNKNIKLYWGKKSIILVFQPISGKSGILNRKTGCYYSKIVGFQNFLQICNQNHKERLLGGSPNKSESMTKYSRPLMVSFCAQKTKNRELILGKKEKLYTM